MSGPKRAERLGGFCVPLLTDVERLASGETGVTEEVVIGNEEAL